MFVCIWGDHFLCSALPLWPYLGVSASAFKWWLTEKGMQHSVVRAANIFQIPTMFQCWAEPRWHSEMSKPWCSPSEPRRDVGRAQGSLQCKTEFKCEAREAGIMTTSGKEKHQSPRWPQTVVELAVGKRARTWGKAKTWRCGMWGPHYFGHMHVFHTHQNPIQVIWMHGVLPTPPT